MLGDSKRGKKKKGDSSEQVKKEVEDDFRVANWRQIDPLKNEQRVKSNGDH